MKQILELCLWKEMALNPESTTFKDVHNEEHPLYRCKFGCEGFNEYCNGYRSKKTLEIINYNSSKKY